MQIMHSRSLVYIYFKGDHGLGGGFTWPKGQAHLEKARAQTIQHLLIISVIFDMRISLLRQGIPQLSISIFAESCQ